MYMYIYAHNSDNKITIYMLNCSEHKENPEN